MYATGVNDTGGNMYIDVCTGVRCKVCDERGEGGGGAQPIMNDQETILVVPKFNTRGLALGKIKLISLLCMVHRKNTKNNKNLFILNIKHKNLAFSFLTIGLNQPMKQSFLLSNTITIFLPQPIIVHFSQCLVLI